MCGCCVFVHVSVCVFECCTGGLQNSECSHTCTQVVACEVNKVRLFSVSQPHLSVYVHAEKKGAEKMSVV